MRDPGVNPPNLAAVQEVAVGLYRVGQNVTVDPVELWVDDIRLADPVSRTGTAASIDARLAASDVGNFTVVLRSGERPVPADQRGSDVPGQQRLPAGAATSGSSDSCPTSLGLVVPMSASYNRTGIDPELLAGTDLEAATACRAPDARIVERDVRAVRPPRGSRARAGSRAASSIRWR